MSQALSLSGPREIAPRVTDGYRTGEEMLYTLTGKYGSVDSFLRTAAKVTYIANSQGKFWFVEENEKAVRGEGNMSNEVMEENKQMNSMMTFQNTQFGEIRTIMRNGEPWFVAADACRALEVGETHVALRRLDEDEKERFSIPTPGGEQEMSIVNEPGLYSLVLGSRKPEARAFKRWITHEVIPAIRKHGGYLTPAKIEEALLNPDTIIQLATRLKDENAARRALEAELIRKDQIIGELKPSADYTDWILKNPGLVTITQIAKDYGMTGNAMNKLLHDLGIQFKQGGQWLLYRKHHGQGYTHSETIHFTRRDGRPDVNMVTKWTQKGRLFIYTTLKEQRGILPTIERGRTA